MNHMSVCGNQNLLIGGRRVAPLSGRVIAGFGKIAGQAFVGQPEVDKTNFTGSPDVGKQIQRGTVGNLKLVTRELGGKSANMNVPDAGLHGAVNAAASGIFIMSRSVQPDRASLCMGPSTTRSSSGWPTPCFAGRLIIRLGPRSGKFRGQMRDS
ncbi:aldehyde dehydrogenase family protein [Mesorhizobium sp. M0959]